MDAKPPSVSRRQHAPKGKIKSSDPIGETHRISDAKRCTAHNKHNGKRCGFAAIPGGRVCRYHGGSAPQVRDAARERLRALLEPAITAYDELIQQTTFPSTRFAAAREVINQEFGRPGESLDVKVTSTPDTLSDEAIMARLHELFAKR